MESQQLQLIFQHVLQKKGGSSTRIQLNPALQPKRGYVNLPGIGSVNAEVATNSLGIQDVIDVFDSDGEFYNNDKFYNRLKGMK